MNNIKKEIFFILCSILFIICIVILGIFVPEYLLEIDFNSKNLPPSIKHIFGTDWLGRDMFFRTLKGLSTSIIVGVFASSISVFISIIMGIISGLFSKICDSIISFIIDFFMGIPHILLLILISFVLGRGFKGIFVGIAITHWTKLARIIRAEVIQIKNEHYVQISRKMGMSNIYIIKNHILPFIMPQAIIGGILLFPNAILHEASITFLGFGFSPETPAIGIILSESMKYISIGYWWLSFFPGILLFLVVYTFDFLGNSIKLLYFQGAKYE